MKNLKLLRKHWKKILIVLVILVVWVFGNSIGLFHIPGIGFKSGGAILIDYKKCTCWGIPNNDIRIGGSRFYCIGIVTDCHCYLRDYPEGTEQEVDCNCPEGKYVLGNTDACNLFRGW
jgi:hypothetical protein